MSDTERLITIFALINAAFFYAFTIVVFVVARKSPVNYALATQKLFWLAIILAVALPTYSGWYPYVPSEVRTGLWLALSVATWWVLYAVYTANWPGTLGSFFRTIWCRLKRRC